MKIDALRMIVPLQIGLAVCGLPALALAPPAQGRMLLVPVVPGSGAHLAADAVARGGRLLAAGPIAGSFVVEGNRDRVTSGLLARGVLVISGEAIDCGDRK